MDSEFRNRLERLYTALGATIEDDLSVFKPETRHEGGYLVHHLDFRGGLSDAELLNLAHQVISHVNHLRDHLDKWAERNGQPKKQSKPVVDSCEALRIIFDLANSDKHGDPCPLDRQWTKKSPKLVDVDRGLAITGSKGSTFQATFGPGGIIPHTTGDSAARAQITGRIVDGNGQELGTYQAVVEEALQAWETLLAKHGLL